PDMPSVRQHRAHVSGIAARFVAALGLMQPTFPGVRLDALGVIPAVAVAITTPLVPPVLHVGGEVVHVPGREVRVGRRGRPAVLHRTGASADGPGLAGLTDADLEAARPSGGVDEVAAP